MIISTAVEVSELEDCKTIKYKHFTIHYNNKEAAISTFNEIFDDKYYLIKTNRESPLIIDGGANIGIATIFFKDMYPQARIICFEPDPNAFQVLSKNVEVNNLTNVTLINAALAKDNGIIDFYGQIHSKEPDARGNSIVEAWGLQRAVSNTIQVEAVKLSSYINEPVDLLKLDIEGAEQQVLEEVQGKLHFVNQITLEIHQSDKIEAINCLDKILNILKHHHFKRELISKNSFDLLPVQVRDWANRIQPHLYSLKAVRDETE